MKLPLYGMIRNNRFNELIQLSEHNFKYNRVSTYNQVANFFIDEFKLNRISVENVYLFCFYGDGIPIGICEVAKGDNKTSTCSLNSIGKYLLLTGCDNFIIVHNHPINNSEPSMDDLLITENLKSLSNLLKVDFEEHIIISRIDWYGIINKRRVII